MCVLILLTYSSHGKMNAIDSLSQGRKELDILLHTLHGVNAESQVWN